MNGELPEQDEAFLRLAQEQNLLSADRVFMLRQEKPFYPDMSIAELAVLKGCLDQSQVSTILKAAAETPQETEPSAAESTTESPAAAPPASTPIGEQPTPVPIGEQLTPVPMDEQPTPVPIGEQPTPVPGEPPEAAVEEPVAAEAPTPPPPLVAPGPAPPQPIPSVMRAKPAAAVARPPVLDDQNVRSFTRLEQYLAFARAKQISDLHLSAGYPPFVRRFGRIEFLNRPVLEDEEVAELILGGLDEEQLKYLEEHLNLESALDIEDQGRYRITIVRQRLGWDGTYRVVNSRVPTISELGLPETVLRLADYRQGMILVTGPGGCGKTSTMAALVDHVNSTRPDHIITLEKPIEYVHQPKKCQVTQRQVGTHTESYHRALRAGLREDPDVILLGEMRDLETISMAITAAETGHLIFGTLHTTTAARTISRILDSYPPHQQPQIRTMMAESLRGIICQQLIPRIDREGVALAVEILIVTPGVSSLIREMKLHQIASVVQTGKRLGMVRMDDSLMQLHKDGAISIEEAHARAEDKRSFAALMPR